MCFRVLVQVTAIKFNGDCKVTTSIEFSQFISIVIHCLYYGIHVILVLEFWYKCPSSRLMASANNLNWNFGSHFSSHTLSLLWYENNGYSVVPRFLFRIDRFDRRRNVGFAETSKFTINKGMMTSSNGNIFRVTGHLCGEFTGPRWIPRTKTSDAELWCFLWSASE